MVWDAIVLAGGRSSRLGGSPKAQLRLPTGETVLERTLAALEGARRIVVVGDIGEIDGPRVIVVRDDPPHGGPAAGIAAGFDALGARADGANAAFVAVLACDMPRIGEAVPTLLAEVGGGSALALDGDRLQYLAGVHPHHVLAGALVAHADELRGLSVRGLLAGTATIAVPVPAGSTDDIDTWSDAERFGAHRAEEQR